MIILEDMGQKAGKHVLKNQWFVQNGIQVMRVPLPVGDYAIANERSMDVLERKEKRGNNPKKLDFVGTYSIAVDTKESIGEIINNICSKTHDRFRDECVLAKNNGMQLYILVENEDDVTCIADLESWTNPRMQRYEKIREMHNRGKWLSVRLPKKPPTDGITLSKAMCTMEMEYGCHFVFCTPQEAGEKVIALLGEKMDSTKSE